ncbi:MAG: zinc ribbon domain-containing protein [Clostridia bacterium]|nr:zinc ribbon domain-containing protein [Clostridia bacterium]
MKSIKPGRGPSMMSGVVGIFMIGFGILWTVIAAQASGIFALFGVLWTGVAVIMTIYNFKNATGKNRYSAFDITDGGEEPDPFNERFGNTQSNAHKKDDVDNKFCPYCGNPVDGDFEFCNNCGKKLP